MCPLELYCLVHMHVDGRMYSLQGECNLITCINIIIRLRYTVTSCVLSTVVCTYIHIYLIYVRIYCMMDIKTECMILPL